MKVIGAGFGRTGTTSLKKALEDLGFGPCYHMQEVIKHPSHVNFWLEADTRSDEAWLHHFSAYQSGIDWPICDFHKRLAVIFPDARFILTVRDPERWYESTLATVYRVSYLIPTWESKLLWPISRFYDMTKDLIWNKAFKGRFTDKDFALRVYQIHVEEVKRVVPSEKLLVFDVREGWEPLCEFLGVPVPDKPFPHLNDRRMMQLLIGMMRTLTVVLPMILIAATILFVWKIVY